MPISRCSTSAPTCRRPGPPARCFALLQAILGIQPDAPRGRIFVDPALPAWLPDITLLDLRLGRRSFDIRFWRDDATTRFEVLRGPAQIVEQRQFYPVAAPA